MKQYSRNHTRHILRMMKCAVWANLLELQIIAEIKICVILCMCLVKMSASSSGPSHTYSRFPHFFYTFLLSQGMERVTTKSCRDQNEAARVQASACQYPQRHQVCISTFSQMLFPSPETPSLILNFRSCSIQLTWILGYGVSNQVLLCSFSRVSGTSFRSISVRMRGGEKSMYRAQSCMIFQSSQTSG